MIEFVLVASILTQGASIGVYDLNTEVVSHHNSLQSCINAKKKLDIQEFKQYNCYKLDKD
jgi:hypothetical protein